MDQAELGTHCKECFFLSEDKKCKYGILDRFIETGAKTNLDSEGNPSVSRICQYERDSEWAKNKTEEEQLSALKEEMYIRGSILLIAKNKESLIETIKKLNKQAFVTNFNFIIIYDNIKSSDMLEICGNNIKSEYICNKVTFFESNAYYIYKNVKYFKNGFLFILECEKDFDDLLIDKVNNVINNKLLRILHVSNNADLHESVNMIHIYKWLKGDLQIPMRDKLRNITNEEQTESQIFTWKEVNEHYSN